MGRHAKIDARPIGTYKAALKAGWNGQGSLIFNLPGFPIALRTDLNYNKFTFKKDLAFKEVHRSPVAAPRKRDRPA